MQKKLMIIFYDFKLYHKIMLTKTYFCYILLSKLGDIVFICIYFIVSTDEYFLNSY